MITALNGRLPTAVLVVADTGANGPQMLRTDAAASWSRMLAAGMPRGCLRSGYRTLAQQRVELAANPTGALPAGQSQHGEGLAADVDEPARSWIAAHGLPFGWRIGFVPGEPWHAQYDQPDQHPSTPAPTTPDPLAQEDDMMLIRASNGTVALIGPKGPVFITPAQLQAWLNLGYSYAPGMGSMDPGPFQAVIDSFGGPANSDYAALSGQIAGLLSALKQAGGGGTIDLAAVTAAAEAGAKAALDGLTLTANPQ